MTNNIIFGDVDKQRTARVRPASPSKPPLWRPARKDNANKAFKSDYDKRPVRYESRHAPELVQAARALGIHPTDLHEHLKVTRKLNKLKEQLS